MPGNSVSCEFMLVGESMGGGNGKGKGKGKGVMGMGGRTEIHGTLLPSERASFN